MRKEVLKALLDISQVVEIIKKWSFSSKTDINNMLKMERRNDIGVNIINKIPIRGDRRKKRDQTSKYIILKNGAYYVHHDWEKNHKVREIVVVTWPRYIHGDVDSKYSYRTLYKRVSQKRGGFWRSTPMRSGQPFRWAWGNWIFLKIGNESQETSFYLGFWEQLEQVMIASSKPVWFVTTRVITLNVYQIPNNFFERYQVKIKSNL